MATTTKTIAKNRTRLLDAIFGGATRCVRHDLDSCFRSVDSDPKYAREALERFRSAKLTREGTHYTVHVHGNLWYEFDSEG